MPAPGNNRVKAMNSRIWGLALATAIMLSGPAAALADVKAGVDAWTQGDYAKAIAEWRPLALAGDADAQFNMGQAYKLGRGVPADFATALDYYRKAAAQGHAHAEDNYGLLLFQQNRRAEAMPYIERSAERGEPRAQYLYGIALFNGDLVAKDWIRAYAMMSRASAAQLPQATASLARMNQYIPDDQREQGLALATRMEQREQAGRLASTGTAVAAPLRQPPRPLRGADLPPSNSLSAGPGSPDPAPPPPSAYVPKPSEKSAPAAPAPATSPAPARRAAASSTTWRVQLGAFGEEGRAEALWKTASGKVKALSGREHYLVKGGNMTRLQAGPLASRDEAETLCGQIKAAGIACIIKAM